MLGWFQTSPLRHCLPSTTLQEPEVERSVTVRAYPSSENGNEFWHVLIVTRLERWVRAMQQVAKSWCKLKAVWKIIYGFGQDAWLVLSPLDQRGETSFCLSNELQLINRPGCRYPLQSSWLDEAHQWITAHAKTIIAHHVGPTKSLYFCS